MSRVEAEKMHALIRIVTRLQAENIQVLQSKEELLKIRDSLPTRSVGQIEGTNSLKDAIEANQETLTKVMHLLKESELSAPTVTHGSLEKLIALGQAELSHAFDSLIDALGNRESIIEERIGAQLKHFGLKERVLLDQKNFNLDLEDINTSTYSTLRPEDVIAMNDQINYVLYEKNISAEEKFSKVMNRCLNPFSDPLWSKNQLMHAEHPDLQKD